MICWIQKGLTDPQIIKVKKTYRGRYEGLSPCGEYHMFQLKKEPKDFVEKIGNIPMAWYRWAEIKRPSGLSLGEEMNAEICANRLAQYMHSLQKGDSD